MPTIHVEAQLSPGDLLAAIEQLGTAELDRFLSQVLALRARRRAPSLPADQAELLIQINRGLPQDLRERLDQLDARREAEALTPEEHAELIRLVTRVEELEAQRIEHLSCLAAIRGVSLPDLMRDLGLEPPDND